jgi:hypothetical protein
MTPNGGSKSRTPGRGAAASAGRLHELGEDLGRDPFPQSGIRLHEAGDVSEVLLALAGPARGVHGGPQLALEDIVEAGHGQAHAEAGQAKSTLSSTTVFQEVCARTGALGAEWRDSGDQAAHHERAPRSGPPPGRERAEGET